MMRILLLSTLIFLSACGWQLRSDHVDLDVASIAITGSSMPLRQALRDQLRLADVRVHDQADQQIIIISEHWQSRTVAVDSAGRAVENEWRYEVRWQYQAADGSPSRSGQPLTLTGSAPLNPEDALASGDENTRTRAQLHDDAARMIMQQLRFLESAR